jgi:hypothetical protein
MKTTLDLPDELMRAVKIRAVERNMKLRELVAEALRMALAAPANAEAQPLDPVQAFGQRLVFLADGSVRNPGGLEDTDSFVDALQAHRADSRREPLDSPFEQR